jgi:hypothetical protein
MRAVPFMFEFEVHTRFLVVVPQQIPAIIGGYLLSSDTVDGAVPECVRRIKTEREDCR